MSSLIKLNTLQALKFYGPLSVSEIIVKLGMRSIIVRTWEVEQVLNNLVIAREVMKCRGLENTYKIKAV
jgi:hypothetical protein